MMKNKIDQEFSAGAVVFRKASNSILFLLIYSGRNKSWGFPKGHIDLGEGEEEAALRETKEETGLNDFNFVRGFRIDDVYRAISNRGESQGREIEKHTSYFLCETDEENINVDTGEITNYRWVTIDKAESLLTFESLKEIIKKSYQFIVGQT